MTATKNPATSAIVLAFAKPTLTMYTVSPATATANSMYPARRRVPAAMKPIMMPVPASATV